MNDPCSSRSSRSSRSSQVVPDDRPVCSSSSSIGTSTHRDPGRTALVLADDTSRELLRSSLLAKLATDLDDPVLARRAARYAMASARLLAGLDWQPEQHDEDADQPLPEVDDLLEQLRPVRADTEADQ